MQCRSFTLRIEKGGPHDLLQLNLFLSRVVPIQVSSSLVQADPPFWAVLVFFEGQAPAVTAVAPAATPGKPKAKDVTPPPARESAPEPAPTSPAFEALRKWRTQKAREEGVPPYVVARNAELEALAAAKPTTLEGLESIPGFGKLKREKYGREILEILARV